MKKENKNPFIRQVTVGFGLLIAVFILSGTSSFVEVNTLGRLISTSYQHPLEVATASLQASMGIVNIHRSMKDVVLTKDTAQIQHDIHHITVEENRVYERLDSIQAKILGSEGQALVKTARQLFVDWKPIRAEVIALVIKGDRNKASLITQGKGADHVFLLEQRMSDLTAYARNKADGFVGQAVTVQKRVSSLVSLFGILGTLLSLAIAFSTIKIVIRSFALRSQAEKDLQGSEKRFRLLVENVPDSIFLFDIHGKFIAANRQACESLGYTLDELQNLSVADIDTKFSLEDVTQVTTTILSNDQTTIVQGIHQRKDGSTFPVETHVAMMEIEDRPLFFALAHDITNRFQAAEVVQQEASLGRIIERSLNEIYIFAADTLRFIQVNKGARENLGYSLEELQNLTPVDIKPKFTKEAFEETIKPLKDNEIEQLVFETWHQRKDGSTYPVEVYLQKSMYQGAQVFVASILDISQRKEAEQKTREAFDIINRSTSIAFLWKNSEDWPVEFVSDNVLGLTGYSAQEFTSGKISYTQRVHPDDIERISREVEEAGKDPNTESFIHTPYRIITKNKEIKWVSDHSQIRRDKDGRITHYQGIVEDITDRKENELALQKSQKEWENTFNSIPDIITIQDKDMRIVRANRAAYTFFDIDEEQLIGKKCTEIFRDTSEPCPGCPLVITLDDMQNHSEIIKHKKLGKIFQVSSSPILDQNNEVQYLVHIAKDITEQKRAEEELFQAHKMEAMGVLAGGIAHDFNNILSAIIGFAELAKDDIPADSKAKKDIDQIITSSKRAVDLVQQILTFSRKSDHHLEPIDPYLIINEALKMLRSSLPTTIDIQEDVDSECGKIMADPTNIHQIIVNLCTNSLHAMKNEKGILSVSLQRKEITAEEILGEPGVSPGLFIVLEVSDTGQGMDHPTMDRILEPYFTTKEVGKGTGLGLAVIHGIIRDYHGFIKVKSEPGQGTSFFVHIPALQQEITTADKVDTNEPLPTGTERILIVDDESLIVTMNKIILERLGYKVSVTTKSLDALERIRNDRDQFDLVITDQTMPKLTGTELAKEILEIKHTMPIILCTGYSSVISEQDALAIGIRQYAQKPVDRTTLAKMVRQVLDENRDCLGKTHTHIFQH